MIIKVNDKVILTGGKVLTVPRFFNPETEEVAKMLTRAKLGGYGLPQNNRLVALDEFVADLIDYGILTKLDRLAQGAYNQLGLTNFSLIDLKNADGNLHQLYGGMTYTANGWKGDGVSGYFDPKFNPTVHGVNYSQNNAGRGVVVYIANVSGAFIIMGGKTTSRNSMLSSNSAYQRLNSDGNILNSAMGFIGTGLQTMYRDDATNVRGYTKGVESLRTETSSATGLNEDYSVFRNAGYYSDFGASLIFFGSALTQTENTNLRTAYNSYLQKIGLPQYA